MEKKLPLISVIIPAYNVEKYIRKCITSVVEQTYKNIEIVVVNDGSSDGTLKIIEDVSQSDNRILIVNKHNSGVSDSRNIGIKKSKGEYIIFVDGDDYLAPDFVEYMYSLAAETKGELCLSTECYTSSEEKDTALLKTSILTAEEATSLLLSPKMYVGCWNKIFKKDIIENNNIEFLSSLFYGEGLYFITQVAQLCKRIGVGNKKVYYYRRDNISSATTVFNIQKFINGYSALAKIEENLILKSESIIGMMDFHRALFCKTAVMKILENKKQHIYKNEFSLFKHQLNNSVPKLVLKKYVSFYYKLLLIMSCVLPEFLVFIDKKRRGFYK